jgi:hypothetical protein
VARMVAATVAVYDEALAGRESVSRQSRLRAARVLAGGPLRTRE